MISEHTFSLVLSRTITADQLSVESLRYCIERFNEEYRKGAPLISDERYDLEFKAALAKQSPSDPLLSRVEPEPQNAFGELPSVRHATPMLSTDNASDADSIAKFIKQVQQAALEIGINDPQFKATGKLDGWAGNDRDGIIATRGDGKKGSNVTHILDRGVIVQGERNQGAGEIVIQKEYFDSMLADRFSCGRNFMASVVNASTPNEDTLQALADGACHFVPYTALSAWHGSGDAFYADHLAICDQIEQQTPYELDGIILEATDEDLKRYMGSTSHHHRWMIAVKLKKETSIQTVQSLEWTTGRSGAVTPTIIYDTVFLSGGNLSRALAHNARRVLDWKIGIGAKVEIVRSGSVIPKIVGIIQPAENVDIPTHCPCCHHALDFDGVKLTCPNALVCSAQVERGLYHFFHIMGINNFGSKTIEKLVNKGFKTLEQIFAMSVQDFISVGFGEGEALRLDESLRFGRFTPVSDAVFLGSFGIHDLGRGDSRKLLEVHPLETLGTITGEQIQKIHGFGNKTSLSIAAQLQERWATIQHLMNLGFDLERTLSLSSDVDSPIKGKAIVFTGAMQHGSRDDMKKQARSLGAKPQSSVSSKTDIVVLGDRVGQKKLDDVAKFNSAGASIQMLSEADYLALIGSQSLQSDVTIFNTAHAA